jgi:uncharacterized membrane protein
MKILAKVGAAIVFRYVRSDRNLSRYALLLSVIVAVQMVIVWLGGTSWWQGFFNYQQFSGSFGSSISLKLLGIFPVIPLLLFMYHTRKEVYLIKGDLSTKASQIRWLGIEGDKISWGKLATMWGDRGRHERSLGMVSM